MLIFKSKPNPSDTFALICDVGMLAIFLWNQFCYGMNMLYFIIPLTLIGVLLAFLVIKPPEYRFIEESLEIKRWLLKPTVVSYNSVFNYETTKHDSFINIGFSNKVKLYYEMNEKKAVVICRPTDAEGFVDVLKARCPELRDEPHSSSIDVFFKEKDK